MIYIDFNKTDNYYEFIDESGGKTIIPSTSVILVDDESGYIAVKLTASRKTIGLLKNTTPPTPPAFTGKWLATYIGGTTSSAECDSTSAITEGEITKNNLAEVEIGNCVTSIGVDAFWKCRSLSSATLGSGVTTIGASAFAECTSLTSIVIPDNVTSIATVAFDGCYSLASVEIGSGVTSIGDWAFNNCSSLTSVTVDSNNAYYDSRNYCNAIIETSTNKLITGCKNTVIPDDVTSIGNGAFRNCSGLTIINIPDSVTSIGNHAFRDCSGLTSCTIGSGVTSIGNSAFYTCTSLTSITVNAVTPPAIESYALTVTNNCPIYVPSASVDAYKAAWSTYADRITAIT